MVETVAAPAIAPVAVAAGTPAGLAEPVVAVTERIAVARTVRALSSPGTSTSAASAVPALPALGTGPSTPDLSGLPPAGRSSFGSGSPSDETAVSQRHGSGQRPAPAGPRRTVPLSGPAGGGNGGGASGPSGGDGAPAAAFFDPATAPAASGLGAATAVERRITWWYPEVVVSPG
jgi:hypothetical protein